MRQVVQQKKLDRENKVLVDIKKNMKGRGLNITLDDYDDEDEIEPTVS